MSGPPLVMSAFVVAWLTARLRLAGPVWLAALGATFAEQSDVLNIGVEGAILLGALTSLLVSFYTGMIWVSLLAGVRGQGRGESYFGLDVRDGAREPGCGGIGVQSSRGRRGQRGLP
jgi:hypothetical protein